MKMLATLLSLVVVIAATACGGEEEPVIDPGDGGDYRPQVPERFVDRIDNPYLPLLPGTRWTYASDDGSERVEVVVLETRRTVMGIEATVVRDTVYEDGNVVEDTYDWFAQDGEGNVWYLGEDSTEFEDGRPASKAGSWEAGVDGALAGVVMWANPAIGRAYRQEYYEGEAEDLAEVVRLDDSAAVAGGEFSGVLVVREWNPLEPGVVEEKYYARGVGMVLEQKTKGGSERVELVSHQAPD